MFNSPYNESLYDKILVHLKIKKISCIKKIKRLKKIIKKNRYDKLLLELDRKTEEEKENIIYKYTSFHGSPFVLKTRELNLQRYMENNKDNDKLMILHFGVFFPKNNTMFHFLPIGIKHGESEYNKELTQNWNLIQDNKKKAFFTLINIDEIKNFAKKWDELFQYNYEIKTSKLFTYTLLYWLL